jgi:hypothetical protein
MYEKDSFDVAIAIVPWPYSDSNEQTKKTPEVSQSPL